MKRFDLKKIYITLSLSALGLALGSIVSFAKLPIYLDTLGIMLTTMLLGWQYGSVCALVTAGMSFFIVSPYVPFYLPSMLAVVFLTELLVRKKLYGTLPKTILSGIFHGIIGTVVSAPITYFLFNGFTSSGNDAIVAFFVSRGLSLLISVVFSLLIFAVIDRVLTCILCVSIAKALPKNFYRRNDLRSNFNEAE